MSNRYPGGIIRRTPTTPTGPFQNGAASGVWTLAEASYWTKQGLWPTQGVLQYWLGIQNGSDQQFAYRIAVDSSGNIYAVGNITVSNSDVLVVKYDPNGTILWQKRYGWSTSSSDGGYGLAVDSSGNIYIAGVGFSVGTIAKLDTNGNILWQKYLSNSSQYVAVGVDNGGNVYAVGFGNGGSTTNALTVKYDANGNLLWQRWLGGTTYVDVSDAVVDSSGNVYGIATSISGNANGLLFKYDTNGNIQFQRSFGNTSSDFGRAIGIDASGNIFIGVHTNLGGTYGQSLVKYDSSGTLQWQRRLDATPEPHQIAFDATGNIYFLGTGNISNRPDQLLVTQYDTSGNLLFQRTLGAGLFSDAQLIAQGIAISGNNMYLLAQSQISSANKFFPVKFPANGTGTGSYFVGGRSYSYEASSFTSSAPSISASSVSFSGSTASNTNEALFYTVTDTTLTLEKTGF